MKKILIFLLLGLLFGCRSVKTNNQNRILYEQGKIFKGAIFRGEGIYLTNLNADENEIDIELNDVEDKIEIDLEICNGYGKDIFFKTSNIFYNTKAVCYDSEGELIFKGTIQSIADFSGDVEYFVKLKGNTLNKPNKHLYKIEGNKIVLGYNKKLNFANFNFENDEKDTEEVLFNQIPANTNNMVLEISYNIEYFILGEKKLNKVNSDLKVNVWLNETTVQDNLRF